ncbi:DUF2285 domain-containing protein [Labrys sp. 22185]|uniref:DUF2285 domain-containing protein n=1 Tax=Labrys sp. 22185 TaxID=3453888 RepID=UPI003F879FCB
MFDVDFIDQADGPLAALVILDDDGPDRLLAITRLLMADRGHSSGTDDRVTAQRRTRLRAMLRAIDGRAEGATYRAIGEALFPKHKLDSKSWVGNSVRETTIRLVRDGLKLVHGGYLDLLRRPRRTR